MIPRILIIAGSDSGGGAGIQADIKTVTMLGGHAMTAITAITAQNTVGVQEVMAVPADMVLAQIDSVLSDIGVDAIKIGMLPDAECVRMVAAALVASPEIRARGPVARRPGSIPIVLDPVLVATSGDRLAGNDVADEILARLVPLATLVTPNIAEAIVLNADRRLTSQAIPVLMKGGDIKGDRVIDMLIDADGRERIWADDRIESRHTHGTGCTLASAIAVGLARGLELDDAISGARRFVRAAILAAPGLGRGHGPMGHNAGLAPFDLLGRSA